MEGFTYCGKHISDFGCRFIPSADDRGDIMSEYEVIDKNFEGRDGGYVYGNRLKPKTFTLKCFYEDITRETKEKLLRWLDRRTKGKLIFDDRPYCYYNVVPSANIKLQDYVSYNGDPIKYSGLFNIEFTAYQPHAIMSVKTYTGTAPLNSIDDTGIIPSTMMPSAPLTSSTSFLVYNCGTENANTIIRIAGDVGTGVTIKNMTTGQECKIVGLTTANTTDQLKWVEISSDTGEVKHRGSASMTDAYEFHDDGYIQLAPCTPFVRDVEISYTSGSKVITTTTDIFEDYMVGQYVFLDDDWRYIGKVNNARSAELSANMVNAGVDTTPIVTMNTITVTPQGSYALTKLEIDYSPTVR